MYDILYMIELNINYMLLRIICSIKISKFIIIDDKEKIMKSPVIMLLSVVLLILSVLSALYEILGAFTSGHGELLSLVFLVLGLLLLIIGLFKQYTNY